MSKNFEIKGYKDLDAKSIINLKDISELDLVGTKFVYSENNEDIESVYTVETTTTLKEFLDLMCKVWSEPDKWQIQIPV